MRRRGACTVAEESVSATLSVAVPAARVFAVLADSTTHCAIDGTGWVQEAVDRVPLAEMGQIFRMDVYHPPTQRPLPDGQPGAGAGPATRHWLAAGYDPKSDGHLEFGGWM